jgi:hypothetical protein
MKFVTSNKSEVAFPRHTSAFAGMGKYATFNKKIQHSPQYLSFLKSAAA